MFFLFLDSQTFKLQFLGWRIQTSIPGIPIPNSSTILLSALGGHSFLQSFSEHSHGLERGIVGGEDPPCPTKVVVVEVDFFCLNEKLWVLLN